MRTTNKFRAFFFNTVNDKRVILIRLIVGFVFLTEGIQKFLFPDLLGVGRFAKIGFSDPAFWAEITGTFEIVCGLFVILGLLIRLASIPLLIIMITAFVTTKWPLLISKGFWPFAHEYRTDFAMTLLLIYILIYGAGKWSADSKVFSFRKSLINTIDKGNLL
jgi:putative oxidoreductase